MKRINSIIGCLEALPFLACMLLASCASGDDSGTLLKGSPLQLKAGMGSAFATRSSTASSETWTYNDIITVADKGIPHKYTIVNGITGEMEGDILWGVNETSKAITAWSYGGGAYTTTLPSSWGVATDQSTEDNLQANDFLYASATATPDMTTPLAFSHKTAKILIRIKSSNNSLVTAHTGGAVTTYVPVNTTFSDVTVKVANVSTFDGTSWSAPTGSAVSITPLYISDSNYLVTYTALVVPQTITNEEMLRFTVTTGSITNTYVYKPASITLAAGVMQILDINFDFDVSLTSITASDWNTTTGGTINSKTTLIKEASGSTWNTTDDGEITTTTP
jgi:hypothetical protein